MKIHQFIKQLEGSETIILGILENNLSDSRRREFPDLDVDAIREEMLWTEPPLLYETGFGKLRMGERLENRYRYLPTLEGALLANSLRDMIARQSHDESSDIAMPNEQEIAEYPIVTEPQ